MTAQFQKLLMDKKLTLLELAGTLKNISQACEIMGYSRQQYYNIKERYAQEGAEGLRPKPRTYSRHPSCADESSEQIVLNFILSNPAYSYVRVSDSLFTEQGIQIPVGMVRGIFNRHKLRTFKNRLEYLQREHQKRGFVLNEDQLALLSRISEQTEYQHVEAPYAGYLLSQDTFSIGYLKGVGKLYMQTVVDCANSLAFGQLYTTKDGLTAAHVLQNRVLPFYRHMGVTIHHILTDNGGEYCGLDDHPYELLLSIFGISHRTTKIKSPHTNGFVERFHKTVLSEFFQRAFRTKFYTSIQELQNDLDQFMVRYNFYRPHRGYRLNGMTPAMGFITNNRPKALSILN